MKTARGVSRWVPIMEWLPRYRPGWLTADLLAGLTVWALIVPESMAYANVAGVPVQYGLYAVPLAVVGYAVFGSSRQLFVGPSSTVAALSAATIAPLAVSTGANPVALTATLALVVGGLYVVGGLLRMGFIARFFARPVLDGFIVGLGIFIAVGQLPKLVGVEKSDGNTIRQLALGDRRHRLVGLVDGRGRRRQPRPSSCCCERYAPRVPGALVVTVLAIALTQAFDLAQHGLAIVGPVPTGFDVRPMDGHHLGRARRHAPRRAGDPRRGVRRGVAIAKTYAAKYEYRIDPNQEMLAYGAASIGAGVLQGYTVSASLSKSAAADDAGAKTPMALVVVSVMVLLTILLIAGVFEHLPEATLAAIVIAAVSGMIDFRKLQRLRAARVVDFWLAVGSLVGVLVLGILPGIVVGVVLSLVLFIHRLDHPYVARLGRSRERTEFGDLDEHPQFVEVPGVLVLRVDAPLIFANADAFVEAIEDAIERVEERDGARLRALVIDLETCFEIDVTGVDALLRVTRLIERKGIELHLARAKAPVRAVLEHLGATATIGPDHLHATVAAAVAATEGRQ